MQSKAKTVREYLAELPDDRREALGAVRDVILKNLPRGYEEGMGYGMISYHVPHSVYPAGYHCNPAQPVPFAALASQKSHMALYLMCIYSDPEHEQWFREAWAASGKKLDMGKSCIRFRKLEDVPLKVIGQAVRKVPVKKFLDHYEAATEGRGKPRKKPAGNAAKRTAKKTATRSAGATAKKAAGKAAKETSDKAAKRSTGNAAKRTAKKTATRSAGATAKKAAGRAVKSSRGGAATTASGKATKMRPKKASKKT